MIEITENLKDTEIEVFVLLKIFNFEKFIEIEISNMDFDFNKKKWMKIVSCVIVMYFNVIVIFGILSLHIYIIMVKHYSNTHYLLLTYYH